LRRCLRMGERRMGRKKLREGFGCKAQGDQDRQGRERIDDEGLRVGRKGMTYKESNGLGAALWEI